MQRKSSGNSKRVPCPSCGKELHVQNTEDDAHDMCSGCGEFYRVTDSEDDEGDTTVWIVAVES